MGNITLSKIQLQKTAQKKIKKIHTENVPQTFNPNPHHMSRPHGSRAYTVPKLKHGLYRTIQGHTHGGYLWNANVI